MYVGLNGDFEDKWGSVQDNSGAAKKAGKQGGTRKTRKAALQLRGKMIPALALKFCTVRVRILEQDCTQPRPDNRLAALASDEKAMERMTKSYSKQASRSQQDYGRGERSRLQLPLS